MASSAPRFGGAKVAALRTEADNTSCPIPIPRLFLQRVRSDACTTAYWSIDGDAYRATTWRTVYERVRAWSMGLVSLGVGPGTVVAIVSEARPEWALLDLANLCVGAVTVGVHPHLAEAELVALLNRVKARVIVVEDAAQARRMAAEVEKFSQPVRIVTIATVASTGTILTLKELEDRGGRRLRRQPHEFERRIAERRCDEIAAYVLTAGTTGPPKAAMLSHRNFHYVIEATNTLVPHHDRRTMAIVPMAHGVQRYVTYLSLRGAVDLHYGHSRRLEPDLQLVRPACVATVPTVVETLYRRLWTRGLGHGRVQRASFRRAVRAMAKRAQRLRAGLEPGLRGRLEATLADRIVGRHMRTHLGGDLRFIGAGGGPLATEVHAFFEAIGIPVLVGYGATETGGPACLSTLDCRRLGTVGRPLPGTEVRIAPDGEVLIRGPGVFQGYHDDPGATAAAVDADGWFRTGDLGALSRDGFLTVTDRKTNLIRTAAGLRIAPRPLERALTGHPWIGQAMVVGHRRPYLGALLALDPDVLPRVAKRVGLAPTADPAEVSGHPIVQKILQQHLTVLNARQPSGQKIQRFFVLSDTLTTMSGELTPTFEIRRRAVSERRQETIEHMYRP